GEGGGEQPRDLRGRAPMNDGERVEVEAAADGRGEAQYLARLARKPLELRAQQLRDVLRDRGRLDRCDVVSERTRVRIERDQLLDVQGLEELPNEERVAGSLPRDHLGERRRRFDVPMQRVRDELSDVARREWRELDAADV